MKYEKIILDMVNDCANAGKQLSQALACVGNMEGMYLYYKPSTPTENGILKLIPDSVKAPEGFILATGEALRCNVPYANYFQWVRSRVNRLPILAHNI